MRRLLAGGGKFTFAELYAGVQRGGPATKFALRSALAKAREAGVVKFDGEKYALGPKREKAATPGGAAAKES